MALENRTFEAIVIGSGMGGLTCAAALAKTGHKVLVLEQHYIPGGLTQTFFRSGFRWDVGVHYIGEMGPGGQGRVILDWLSGGAIQFASMGEIYDIVHFPDGFVVEFPRTEAALKTGLKARFPGSAKEIDAYFAALAAADLATSAVFMQRAAPAPVAKVLGLWRGREIGKYWARTSAAVMNELISDPKLRTVLLAQRGNYGGFDLDGTSFGVQALVTRHYYNGAFYPVGGAKVFAETLMPVIEQAGGEVRLKTKVRDLLVENGAVTGVILADDQQIRAPKVISDAGARNTVAMLPAVLQAGAWARDIRSFAPSPCHVSLYLGLEGDIGANGASTANHWFHETWELHDGLWRDPAETPAPGIFVSFPTLKDPTHQPGDRRRHTAEVVSMVDWKSFARWKETTHRDRPEDYQAFKAVITKNLLAQFARHFPGLAPLVVAKELSTPLSTIAYTGAEQGAIYGLEVSPRRFLSETLRAKTPIPGLFLTGQDVACCGVTGAMMGGMFAAAALEPRVFPHLR